MKLEIEIEIDCDADEELVARVLHASNWCPGRPYSEAPWPPTTKMALSKYIRQAKLVVAAQREALRVHQQDTRV